MNFLLLVWWNNILNAIKNKGLHFHNSSLIISFDKLFIFFDGKTQENRKGSRKIYDVKLKWNLMAYVWL